MPDLGMQYRQYTVQWIRTGDAFFPWQAKVDHQDWVLRINEFPEEPLYTLFIDDEEIGDFDDWPRNWSKEPRA
jgi:hypothetical protein